MIPGPLIVLDLVLVWAFVMDVCWGFFKGVRK